MSTNNIYEMSTNKSRNRTSTSKRKKMNLSKLLIEVIAVIVCIIVFLIPFYFIIVNSFKTSSEAAKMNLSWPEQLQFGNFVEALTARDNMLVLAYFNSTTITLVSIAILVVVCSMTGFVLQRRMDKRSSFMNNLFLVGLMIPPAIVPTIWVLERLYLFKTMPGIILIMVAIQIPFTILLYRGFIATIPRDIDEAANLDGCGSWSLFFRIIFPMLMPIHSTVLILNTVNIFNDFVHPLYFFPGADNATVQLTLYNFMSMYNTSWNLLFANVLLITIPPFILFMIFNNKIVAGMTAGAVKG